MRTWQLLNVFPQLLLFALQPPEGAEGHWHCESFPRTTARKFTEIARYRILTAAIVHDDGLKSPVGVWSLSSLLRLQSL